MAKWDGPVNLDEFERLAREGWPDSLLGERYGIETIRAARIRRRLGVMRYDACDPAEAPTPEDEEASLAGLALSPWVESRAALIRAAHLEQRRQESDEATRSKLCYHAG